jgi:hypothetical protein
VLVTAKSRSLFASAGCDPDTSRIRGRARNRNLPPNLHAAAQSDHAERSHHPGHISLKIFDLTSATTGPGPGFIDDGPAFFMFDTTFRGNRDVLARVRFAAGRALFDLQLRTEAER